MNSGIGGIKKIRSPGDIYPLLAHYGDRQQEYFFSICLNGAHEVIDVRTVSKGILNRAIIHPREVFSTAIELRSASIMVGTADIPDGFYCAL